MRIHEIILENNQIDELSLKGIGQGLGKVAGAVGSAVGGAQGAWAGMKNAYGQSRDRMAPVAQRNVQRAGGYKTPGYSQPAPAAAPGTTAPANPNAAPSATTPANPAAASGTTAPAAPSAPQAKAQKNYPAVQARTDVAAVVGNIQKVRSRDRADVVQFAQRKLATVKEDAVFHSLFLGRMI